MASLLEAQIQFITNALPKRIAIGFDHHAAPNGRVVRKISLLDDLVIPLGEVLLLGCQKVSHRVSLPWFLR